MFEPKKPKKAIMSISGKGGVGKTLIACNIAIGLSKKHRVGLLDADIKSPNSSLVLGIKANEFKHKDNSYRKILPVEYNGLKVFSTAIMFPDFHGITISGEQQRNFLRQAVYDVEWGALDYLVVDMDPSSGDSLLCMREIFKDLQAVVVSTSDVSSLSDCNRIVHACIIHNIPIIGVVANMVSSECPFCHNVIICKNCGTSISFGDEQKVKDIAEKFHVPFIGSIYFNPEIKMRNNAGNPLLPDMKIVDDILGRLL